MEPGPTTMAVTPTTEQLEYIYDNPRLRILNGSLVWGAPGEFYLSDSMRILSLILILVGLVDNSMVLWLLNFRTCRNPFSIYVLNLAWADLLFLCCYFLMLVDELVRHMYSSFMYVLLTYLANAFYNVSLSLLAVISIERCLALLFPSWYLHDCLKNTSATVCTVLWALLGLFWVVDIFLCISVTSQFFYGAFSSIRAAWLVHFTPVMCGSSLTLLLRVQCSLQSQQLPRFYLFILLMLLMFLFCGLPRGIQATIRRFPLHSMGYWLFRFLVCLKSSTYPFIYFILGSRRHIRGREPLGVILQRALADKQELEGERRDIRLTNIQETSF